MLDAVTMETEPDNSNTYEMDPGDEVLNIDANSASVKEAVTGLSTIPDTTTQSDKRDSEKENLASTQKAEIKLHPRSTTKVGEETDSDLELLREGCPFPSDSDAEDVSKPLKTEVDLSSDTDVDLLNEGCPFPSDSDDDALNTSSSRETETGPRPNQGRKKSSLQKCNYVGTTSVCSNVDSIRKKSTIQLIENIKREPTKYAVPKFKDPKGMLWNLKECKVVLPRVIIIDDEHDGHNLLQVRSNDHLHIATNSSVKVKKEHQKNSDHQITDTAELCDTLTERIIPSGKNAVEMKIKLKDCEKGDPKSSLVPLAMKIHGDKGENDDVDSEADGCPFPLSDYESEDEDQSRTSITKALAIVEQDCSQLIADENECGQLSFCTSEKEMEKHNILVPSSERRMKNECSSVPSAFSQNKSNINIIVHGKKESEDFGFQDEPCGTPGSVAWNLKQCQLTLDRIDKKKGFRTLRRHPYKRIKVTWMALKGEYYASHRLHLSTEVHDGGVGDSSVSFADNNDKGNETNAHAKEKEKSELPLDSVSEKQSLDSARKENIEKKHSEKSKEIKKSDQKDKHHKHSSSLEKLMHQRKRRLSSDHKAKLKETLPPTLPNSMETVALKKFKIPKKCKKMDTGKGINNALCSDEKNGKTVVANPVVEKNAPGEYGATHPLTGTPLALPPGYVYRPPPKSANTPAKPAKPPEKNIFLHPLTGTPMVLPPGKIYRPPSKSENSTPAKRKVPGLLGNRPTPDHRIPSVSVSPLQPAPVRETTTYGQSLLGGERKRILKPGNTSDVDCKKGKLEHEVDQTAVQIAVIGEERPKGNNADTTDTERMNQNKIHQEPLQECSKIRETVERDRHPMDSKQGQERLWPHGDSREREVPRTNSREHSKDSKKADIQRSQSRERESFERNLADSSERDRSNCHAGDLNKRERPVRHSLDFRERENPASVEDRKRRDLDNRHPLDSRERGPDRCDSRERRRPAADVREPDRHLYYPRDRERSDRHPFVTGEREICDRHHAGSRERDRPSRYTADSREREKLGRHDPDSRERPRNQVYPDERDQYCSDSHKRHGYWEESREKDMHQDNIRVSQGHFNSRGSGKWLGPNEIYGHQEATRDRTRHLDQHRSDDSTGERGFWARPDETGNIARSSQDRDQPHDKDVGIEETEDKPGFQSAEEEKRFYLEKYKHLQEQNAKRLDLLTQAASTLVSNVHKPDEEEKLQPDVGLSGSPMSLETPSPNIEDRKAPDVAVATPDSTGPDSDTANSASERLTEALIKKFPPQYVCEICNIDLRTNKIYYDHINGVKHQKRVKLWMEGGKVETVLHCIVCSINICNSKIQYAEHLSSAKHKKKVQVQTLLGKPPPSEEPVLLTLRHTPEGTVASTLGSTITAASTGKPMAVVSPSGDSDSEPSYDQHPFTSTSQSRQADVLGHDQMHQQRGIADEIHNRVAIMTEMSWQNRRKALSQPRQPENKELSVNETPWLHEGEDRVDNMQLQQRQGLDMFPAAVSDVDSGAGIQEGYRQAFMGNGLLPTSGIPGLDLVQSEQSQVARGEVHQAREFEGSRLLHWCGTSIGNDDDENLQPKRTGSAWAQQSPNVFQVPSSQMGSEIQTQDSGVFRYSNISTSRGELPRSGAVFHDYGHGHVSGKDVAATLDKGRERPKGKEISREQPKVIDYGYRVGGQTLQKLKAALNKSRSSVIDYGHRSQEQLHRQDRTGHDQHNIKDSTVGASCEWKELLGGEYWDSTSLDVGENKASHCSKNQEGSHGKTVVVDYGHGTHRKEGHGGGDEHRMRDKFDWISSGEGEYWDGPKSHEERGEERSPFKHQDSINKREKLDFTSTSNKGDLRNLPFWTGTEHMPHSDLASVPQRRNQSSDTNPPVYVRGSEHSMVGGHGDPGSGGGISESQSLIVASTSTGNLTHGLSRFRSASGLNPEGNESLANVPYKADNSMPDSSTVANVDNIDLSTLSRDHLMEKVKTALNLGGGMSPQMSIASSTTGSTSESPGKPPGLAFLQGPPIPPCPPPPLPPLALNRLPIASSDDESIFYTEDGKRAQEHYKFQISSYIVSTLNQYQKPDCPVGRITSNEDFKFLARKLTHEALSAELKQCKRPVDLEVNRMSVDRARILVNSYMASFGPIYINVVRTPSP